MIQTEIGPTVKRPTISVVVPFHQIDENFARCIGSVLATEPRPNEIILVADCAKQPRLGDMKNDTVKVVCTGAQLGPAAARNMGADISSGDVIFFVDSDVELPKKIIDQVKSLVATYPDQSAFIGSYDDSPGASNFSSQYRNLLHHFVHQAASPEAFSFWGACGVIRKDAWLKCGGFDENYATPSIEDIELGYRLCQLGDKIRLCKELQDKHLKRWTLKSILHTDLLRRAIPWTILICQSKEIANGLNISNANRYKVAIVGMELAATLAGPFWSGGFLLALMLLLVWMALELPLLRKFAAKRGIGFAAAVIPYQLLHYVICGIGFIVGSIIHSAYGRVPTRRTKVPHYNTKAA